MSPACIISPDRGELVVDLVVQFWSHILLCTRAATHPIMFHCYLVDVGVDWYDLSLIRIHGSTVSLFALKEE